MEFSNNKKQIINTSQELYDSFNSFIFSSDTKVFSKLMARCLLADQVKNVPGDIVECGVFKGSGVLTWLKLKKMLSPNSIKKVIGFDFFDTDSLLRSLVGDDLVKMKDLFESRNYTHNEAAWDYLHTTIKNAGFSECDYELVKGDIRESAYDFVHDRPGFKISLLYLDLDLEQPTYDALQALWDRVSTGGLVVFDEYAYHQWSESLGVDKFFENKGVRVKTLDYLCPTAYVQK